MKIAFIGQKGIPAKQGGVEKHVQELSTRLVSAGFDVAVYSRYHYTTSNARSYKGVTVINLPSLNTKHFDAISHSFLATIHAIFSGATIIHYHGVGPSLLAWIPRLVSPKTTVISTFHTIDRHHQKWGIVARLILALGEYAACRFPHQTIAVSRVLKKYSAYRFDRETTYIPNGVKVTNTESKSPILKKFDLKTQEYVFVASRLVQHKGIHTLIKAYQQATTDKKLVIAGDSSNTSAYVEQLKIMARADKRIIFVGQQTGADLEVLFRNAYLFVQPSETEGLSIALLEAMAYNVPLLISDIEENQEATAGLALEFATRNTNDLARQLNFALKHPNFIKRQARLAKTRVGKEYDWDDITQQTVKLYRNTVTERVHGKLKIATR
jgi:glycosyltransferase involved in cell wall biosynthesis